MELSRRFNIPWSVARYRSRPPLYRHGVQRRQMSGFVTLATVAMACLPKGRDGVVSVVLGSGWKEDRHIGSKADESRRR